MNQPAPKTSAFKRHVIAIAAVATALVLPVLMAAQQTTTAPATTQMTMRFKDASVDAVIKMIADASGYKIDASELPGDCRVTVWCPDPMGPDKAVELLNSMLESQGHKAVVEGNVMKIVTCEKTPLRQIVVTDHGVSSTTLPAVTISPPVSELDGMSTEDLLKRLKAKRAAEMRERDASPTTRPDNGSGLTADDVLQAMRRKRLKALEEQNGK